MLHASILDYAETDAFFAEPLQLDWTPAHVRTRMVEAFDVLRRMSGRIGPKAYGSNWPAILRDIADMNDVQAYEQAQKDGQKVRHRPTLEEISRMDEALHWPWDFLDSPRERDAINLWAMATAWDLNLAGIMRARAKAAADLARIRERDENARRSAARAQEAARAAAWGNRRLALCDGSPGARERILANATIRLGREVEKLRPVLIKPSTVVPDKVLSRTSMDRHAYRAAKAVAEGLEAKGVSVR